MTYSSVLVSKDKPAIKLAISAYCPVDTLFIGTTEAILYKVTIENIPYLVLFNIWSYLPLVSSPGTASVSGYVLTVDHRSKKGEYRVFHGTTVVIDPLLELSKVMSAGKGKVNYLNNVYQDLIDTLNANPLKSLYSHLKFTEDLIARIEK